MTNLAGMTGTADTEAFEFQQIYGLETVVIPTNRPMIRDDRTDVMFENEEYKFNAIIEDIKDCVARNQPVLVGTVSVEKSEMLSQALDKAGIKHNVLNAKFHAQEAEIVAEAGGTRCCNHCNQYGRSWYRYYPRGQLESKSCKIREPNSRAN